MLRVDGEKVVLKRPDAKEISVALALLSDADRKYVESIEPDAFAATDARRPEPATPAERSESEQEPAQPEVPITETHLGEAEVVDLSGDAWTYRPDAASQSLRLRNVRLPLAKMDFFENPQQILLSPAEQRAFVVNVQTHRGQKINVQALDLQRGRISGSGLFSTQVAPIAVSPDGQRILARSQSFGFGKQTELRLYTRDGLKATPEKAWVPYHHHAADGLHSMRNADVVWAEFLGNDRVMTLSEAGELAVWTIAELKPLYQIKLSGGTLPALSRGGKYVAVAVTDGVAILQVDDGKLAGLLPADLSGFGKNWADFSPDGRKLALLSGGTRLRVWDLTTQKLEREFPVDAPRGTLHGGPRELAWIDGNFLLVGSTVYDVEHYSPVWTYRSITPWVEFAGRVWFVADRRTAPVLTSGVVPAQAVRDKWAKIAPEEMLVIAPGAEVAVELQTADPHTAEVRESIVRSLTERGLKVVPQSDIKLIGTIGPGDSKTLNYRTIGGFNRGTTSVTVQGYVATLSYVVNGQTVWQYTTQTGAPLFVHMKQGDSVASAAQSQAQMTSKVFERVWIPVHVPRPDADADKAISDYPNG